MQGAFDAASNTGVVPLHACGPNGATVGPHDNLLLGCTPGNNPSNTTTLVINAKTKNYANIANITGSDEVWFNSGDRRYYLGASKMTKQPGSPLGSGAVLGVVDGTSVLIETIPQSSEFTLGGGRLQAQPDLRSAGSVLWHPGSHLRYRG